MVPCEDGEEGVEAPRRATDCAMPCPMSTSSCSLRSGGVSCSRAAGAKDQVLLFSSINISVPARRTMRERNEQKAEVMEELPLSDDCEDVPKDRKWRKKARKVALWLF